MHPVLFLLQHWQRLAQGGPIARSSHAAISFTQSNHLSHMHILVVGGDGGDDSWICDMRTMMWKKVSVPRNQAVIPACTCGHT